MALAAMKEINERETMKDKDQASRSKPYIDIIGALIMVFLTIFLNPSSIYADTPTVKAKGILTSIEEDSTVIIDQKGYKIDKSVLVINDKGRPIPLRSLSIPTYVRFEYRYAHDGFAIEYIEQLKAKAVIKRMTR